MNPGYLGFTNLETNVQAGVGYSNGKNRSNAVISSLTGSTGDPNFSSSHQTQYLKAPLSCGIQSNPILTVLQWTNIPYLRKLERTCFSYQTFIALPSLPKDMREAHANVGDYYQPQTHRLIMYDNGFFLNPPRLRVAHGYTVHLYSHTLTESVPFMLYFAHFVLQSVYWHQSNCFHKGLMLAYVFCSFYPLNLIF